MMATSNKESKQYFAGRIKRFLFFLALLLTAGVNNDTCAQTGEPCPPWLKTVMNTQDKKMSITTPAVTPMRRVAEAIESMMRKNEAFNSIPELRRRVSCTLLVDSLYGVGIGVNAFDKNNWKGCGLVAAVNWLDPAIYISFQVNNRQNFIINQFDNVFGFLEKLEAFAEPEFVEMIAGNAGNIPVYRTGVTKKSFVLLTYNGKVPWIPLTLAEYLTAFKGELGKQKADYDELNRRFAKDTASFDPWKNTKEYYEHLKKTNPKAAEEHRLYIEKLIANKTKDNAARVQLYHKRDSTLHQLTRDLQHYRASLTPLQLQGAAFAGYNKFHLWDESQKYPKRPLVKLAQEFRSYPANRNMVRMITIFAGGIREWRQYVSKLLSSLDYELLKSFMK